MSLTRFGAAVVAFLSLSLCSHSQAVSCGEKCIEIATQFIPYGISRDNYGQFVAEKYFAFDVAVANKTDATIYINAFLFKRPDDDVHPYLNSDARLVRGSIEKGQLVGHRNIAITTLTAVGNVASGLSGFFKAAGSAATAGRIIAAYNGPALSGLGAVFPDTTIKYLNNWDQDTVFKNGFVISKGQTQRGRVFIPIETLFPEYKRNDSKHKRARDFRIEEIRDRIEDVRVLGFSAAQIENLTEGSSRSFKLTGP